MLSRNLLEAEYNATATPFDIEKQSGAVTGSISTVSSISENQEQTNAVLFSLFGNDLGDGNENIEDISPSDFAYLVNKSMQTVFEKYG